MCGIALGYALGIGESDALIQAGTGLPANCTEVQPPVARKDVVRVFNEASYSWEELPDNRGRVVYIKATGDAVEVEALGALSDEVTTLAYPGPYYRWVGKSWRLDDKAQRAGMIADAQAMRFQLLEQANKAIAPLQAAIDLDMATEAETAALLAWKKYLVLLNRIDPQLAPDIDWPEVPENVA